MVIANVSFGIHAFLPSGWLFMTSVVLLEGFVLHRLLDTQSTWKRPLGASAVANTASGAVGIVASLAMNGGWWLVVWFPWVSSYEVSPEAYGALAVYYAVAFVVSILIEVPIALWVLRRLTPQPTWALMTRAVASANVISYVLGTVVMYGYSFS